jgi:lipoprotein-anchoring transpeptidase ErfK/SrfK
LNGYKRVPSSQITISIHEQCLSIITAGKTRSYSISTALKGTGQLMGSLCTPLGKHIVRAKIGEKLPLNSVFIARRPTGEIYSDTLARSAPNRDWILTRIMWLCGTEPGVNRFGDVDSMRRFIYIHGTPDTEQMGIPASHGCIRMRNIDVAELFDITPIGTTVDINP